MFYKIRKLSRILLNAQLSFLRLFSDILPTSEVVIIKQAKKIDSNLKKENVSSVENNLNNNSKEFRVNEVNIQMISKNIYDQLFKKQTKSIDCNIIKR